MMGDAVSEYYNILAAADLYISSSFISFVDPKHWIIGQLFNCIAT